MGSIDAYAMFEGYLSDLLKERLRQHPRLMGSQRHLSYEQILEAASKDDTVETMIDREIAKFTYLSLSDLLTRMRERLGFEIDKVHETVMHTFLYPIASGTNKSTEASNARKTFLHFSDFEI